ncbi:glycosyltransferase family 4 protein [Microbacterium sp. ASV49]|uniref:Glycosyltransferase family 4 protein n=1 Tax=Microbacterium candidum TaxID=3041922 RepID=A0ABT7MUZ7_9MICO|nr:glycosyltransferase family 4 protein [Microbacterium sp. ASV49]MDL9978281.1 glycosyltransferase family 4 protein [Microbacterium sp. ASV49]
MTRIIQIAPEIAPGSGVGGVAYELERAFDHLGVQTSRFTLRDSGLAASHGSVGRLTRARNVLWFSTVGTILARRRLRSSADAIAICHNDVMAGDIYVNHGVLQASLRARGHFAWRIVRNPLHIFTIARDRIRYRGSVHRAVVALTQGEAAALRAEYGRVHPPITVIPNGVDLERFRVPSPTERERGRDALQLPRDAFVAVFVGHEFDRKGLPLVLAALPAAAGVHLVVAGGSPADVRQARIAVEAQGLDARVTFLGTLPDVLPVLHAADVLVLPSAYEANALVVLEALACGVPAIATPVGAAPELLADGRAGEIVHPESAAIAQALRNAAARERDEAARAARDVAERYGWAQIAQRYLDLVRTLEVAGARQ